MIDRAPTARRARGGEADISLAGTHPGPKNGERRSI